MMPGVLPEIVVFSLPHALLEGAKIEPAVAVNDTSQEYVPFAVSGVG